MGCNITVVNNSSIKKYMSLGFAKCGPKKNSFLFSSFIAANQTLKYHGDKTLIA